MEIQNIVDTLLLNGTLVDCPGLLQGKTGIAVYFFHYAQHTGNELFEDYAADLIAEIQAQIHTATPVDYEKGLAGIGVGIEYLMQNGFIEAENNDIFEDIDRRMYRAAMYEPYLDLSLAEGLSGWGRYFVRRLQGNTQSQTDRLNEALAHIVRELEQKLQEKSLIEAEQTDVFCFLRDLRQLSAFSRQATTLLSLCMEFDSIRTPDIKKIFPYLGDSSTENLARLYHCQQYFGWDMSNEIDEIFRQLSDVSATTDMGLLKGCAGEGLCLLAAIDRQNISWIHLL